MVAQGVPTLTRVAVLPRDIKIKDQNPNKGPRIFPPARGGRSRKKFTLLRGRSPSRETRRATNFSSVYTTSPTSRKFPGRARVCNYKVSRAL